MSAGTEQEALGGAGSSRLTSSAYDERGSTSRSRPTNNALAALVLLLQLVLQGSSAGEAERLALEYEAGSGDVPWGWNSWSRTAWEAWGVSLVHTLILQDGAKVVLVALVSPLVLPSLLPPERQSWRARVLRLGRAPTFS